MAEQVAKEIRFFKGLKNDENIKQIPFEYFYRMKNFNYPSKGILGLDKIFFPKRIKQLGTTAIDGLFEYKFLDVNNILRTHKIGVVNGSIYKDVLTTPVLLKSGLSTGLCSFTVFQDKLFIANGKNYINVYNGNTGLVYEMGAPEAITTTTTGLLNGTYYYAITYVTAGGEEVIGSVSNTITVALQQVTLNLPIGYTGTLTRKIYRTEASGTQLKLLATISNNTDLTYTDNIADGSLTTAIPLVNNELPKPYFIITAQQKLYGTVVDKYPTQTFKTSVNNEVFDAGNFLDITNYGIDNTAITGMGEDFNKIVIGSNKNIFFIDPSTDTVVLTRANVGFKNGYSVKKIPATADFPGGLMFVSSLNDIRVMSGLQALPVATSLDNVRSQNWSQDIRGTLENDLKLNKNIYAEFYDYKYHLLVNYVKYVFDIRTNGWTYHDIRTENYNSQPTVLAIFENFLYNGQSDGWIEEEYSEQTYRGEDVTAYLESGYMDATNLYKVVQKFIMWFVSTKNAEVTVEVTVDNNDSIKSTTSFILNNNNYVLSTPDLVKTFLLDGGVFDKENFSQTDFLVDNMGMDYKAINVNKMCRWIKYKLINTKGNISFQGFQVIAQKLLNKE